MMAIDSLGKSESAEESKKPEETKTVDKPAAQMQLPVADSSQVTKFEESCEQEKSDDEESTEKEV